MYLESIEGKNQRVDRVQVGCDDCGAKYDKSFMTTQRQLKSYSKHLCKTCLKKYREEMKTSVGYCQSCEDEGLNPNHKLSGPALAQNLRNHGGLFLCRRHAHLGKETSQETKEKLREIFKGRELSEEHKSKISKTLKERDIRPTKACIEAPNPRNTGQSMPEAAKEAISRAHLGKKKTDSQRRKISESRKKLLNLQGGLLPETREKLSLSTVKQYQENPTFNKHFKQGWFDSEKRGKKVHYRSSYELRFLECCLEKDKEVISFESEPLSIEYETEEQLVRRYLPDFRVDVEGLGTFLVEVKPHRLVRASNNLQKAKAGRDLCEKMGWQFICITEKDLQIDEHANPIEGAADCISFKNLLKEVLDA